MTKILSEFANQDTPTKVYVPQTYPGLIVWAFGRFGIGLLGFFFAYFIYTDMRRDTDRVFSMIENQARVNAETAAAIHALRQRIEENIYNDRHVNRP